MTADPLVNPPTDGLETEAGRSLVALLYGAFFAFIGDAADERFIDLMTTVRKGVDAIEAEAAWQEAPSPSLGQVLIAELLRLAVFEGDGSEKITIDEAIAAIEARFAQSSPGPCSGCRGRRWADDENWQPNDPKTWRGERSPGDGLIPCGFCNEAGWDTPLAPPIYATGGLMGPARDIIVGESGPELVILAEPK